MINKLQELTERCVREKYATGVGRSMHAQMQYVFYTSDGWVGDADILSQIKDNPELRDLMGKCSKTEVPLAGYIGNKFISRRIDRLYVNNDTKTVVVLDYKTDKDKRLFYRKYVEQLNEYRELLKQIYRHFDIQCKILWLSDFTLENLPVKDIIDPC